MASPLRFCRYLFPVFNGPIYIGILPDICSLLSVPNFPNMINLSRLAFQALSPEYTLKSVHKRVIVLG